MSEDELKRLAENGDEKAKAELERRKDQKELNE